MKIIKKPSVAGTFYPADASLLRQEVDEALAAGRALLRQGAEHAGAPKVVVAPHAGYRYSASIAGVAYAAMTEVGPMTEVVIVFGPLHRVSLRGFALPVADALETPLGLLEVDAHARAVALGSEGVIESRAPHEHEHSIEVQWPFVQRVFPNARVLAVGVGEVTPQQASNLLERLWGGPETRIVISSDLSHFLPYASAQGVDQKTMRALERAELVSGEQACGARALSGLSLQVKARTLEVSTLALCNSGDTSGDRGRVVGYGALGYWEPAP